MSRLPLSFGCGTFRLAATLDTAPGTAGLLIVTGGNEIRSGAFSGQAKLAARIARAGFPVFRFDRRGVGDSEGENRGFRRSAKDIAAAIEAFRAIAPQIERVVAFGNCDAASALMLASGAGCDSLVLSNPWTIEQDESVAQSDDTPPPAAIRARYLEKLKNPREIARLLSGGVDLGKLARGLARSLNPAPPPSSLAQRDLAGTCASCSPPPIAPRRCSRVRGLQLETTAIRASPAARAQAMPMSSPSMRRGSKRRSSLRSGPAKQTHQLDMGRPAELADGAQSGQAETGLSQSRRITRPA
jgi:exosortase A-associated hydrolase 1